MRKGFSMSGGHFDYKQWGLLDLADKVKELLDTNESTDEYGYTANYSKETIDKFEDLEFLLKITSILLHRVDYLVSADDSEEDFHKRLAEDLENNA